MSLPALALLIVAALLHAGWNLLLKQAGEKYIASWWGIVVSSVICLPILAFRPPIPAQIWPYLLASAVCEALYFAALAGAYQVEDFSLIYPLARGGAPALLAVWSILFLKETPRPAGLVGLGLVTFGLIVVGSSQLWAARKKNSASAAGLGLAMLVALFISIYSAIDGAAVKRADPLVYVIVAFWLTGLFATPVVLWLYGWRAVRAQWQAHWPRASAIGVISLLAYLLVLVAYSFSPVSYVGAIREISIVFGAIAGWLWLKERFGPLRTIGAAIIFAGILTILAAG
ncbi:MAG TPA: EamA family transporter [Anaerolineaceae bacterium]|nr:EamA family transporter [Anaerolineaceae bacterium]